MTLNLNDEEVSLICDALETEIVEWQTDYSISIEKGRGDFELEQINLLQGLLDKLKKDTK